MTNRAEPVRDDEAGLEKLNRNNQNHSLAVTKSDPLVSCPTTFLPFDALSQYF